MKHVRIWSVVVAVLLVGFSVRPVQAVSPWAVMVYGGSLETPVLLRPGSPAEFPAFGLLWWQAGSYMRPDRTVRSEPALSRQLSGRPYLKLAIFWGQYGADELAPENASQHGRFYFGTTSEPAVVVVTVPDMQKHANPIPRALEGFAAVWDLGPEEIGTLRDVGFPGLGTGPDAGAIRGAGGGR
ncbi:MAG: hypothetical protein R2752_21530 [Vicinamibacterales bacterium]